MKKEKIRDIVSKMTLEEKAGLCSGASDWLTKEVGRLNIPSIWLTDGPHGLRKQEGLTDNLGIYESKPAVSFPSECATAASFDRVLLKKIGETLGEEGQAENIQVLLGPGINIKRSPLCGRSFEYFSEDPLLAGELGAAYVEGVQSQGIGACVKHFLANNQETRRMTSSSEVDERTLREIYMPAFERVVKKVKPWAVMCSYNKINGTYASENRQYMTDILRKEWEFDGCVISDWGAVHNRAGAVAAGVDLTMPAAVETDEKIAEAVREGKLPEFLLDEACINILELVRKGEEGHRVGQNPDLEKGHELSRYAAEESAVLLKNEEGILPLNPAKKIAFIGQFAEQPRYQGGGSSKVNAARVMGALEAVQEVARISYSAGYTDSKTDKEMLVQAAEIARDSDVAVVFVGLTPDMESEGCDRQHMRLPEAHEAVIAAVAEVQPNMVIVLHNGSPVEMPWIDKAKGVLEMYLGGEAIGEATVNLLFGKSNPSGRLPETFPLRLEDNPSYLFYFGTGNKVEYREGIYVGYRYYESKKQNVLFPFGYGLSYTKYSYSNLKVDKTKFCSGDILNVSVDVTNTGECIGKEVIQLYVAVRECEVLRPIKELRGFDKIELAPGETKTVLFQLEQRDFSYWNEEAHCFHMPAGSYEIQIGRSAHEVILSARIKTEEQRLDTWEEFTMESLLGEIMKHSAGSTFMETYTDELCEGIINSGMAENIIGKSVTKDEILPLLKGMQGQTLMTLKMFLPGLGEEVWNGLLEDLNSDWKEH
ncbi:beta-glucosidase family protein [Konateibacter massiliensis]|uniref:beta-glucosidase family protein n=1 Tax=Konateibacter massiliensis TaxID=2002841 RepID=UPI000C15698A|nr:glycoside hydrolase family 3 C-terminal domain-containing protein [Konateibacter massiliensis]